MLFLHATVFDSIKRLLPDYFMLQHVGTAFGMCEGVLHIWVIMLAVSKVQITSVGQVMMEWTSENPFLTYLYNNNPLMGLI